MEAMASAKAKDVVMEKVPIKVETIGDTMIRKTLSLVDAIMSL